MFVIDKVLIVKILGAGLIGIVGTTILKKYGKEDIAIILDLALILGVMYIVFDKVRDTISAISTMFGL